MKSIALALVLTSALAVASCAQSLEQIVDQRHQARLDASMNNQPLRHGAGDGIGSRNAQVEATATMDTSTAHDPRLSLAAPGTLNAEPDVSKNR